MPKQSTKSTVYIYAASSTDPSNDGSAGAATPVTCANSHYTKLSSGAAIDPVVNCNVMHALDTWQGVDLKTLQDFGENMGHIDCNKGVGFLIHCLKNQQFVLNLFDQYTP